MVRRGIYYISVFLILIWMALSSPSHCEASSCVIQFSTDSAQVKPGEIFTIVCQVTSTEPFLNASFVIDYDDAIMQFVKGGRKVSGDFGELTVDSGGNTEETYKKTFSLQFRGKAEGSGLISVKDMASITDADGNAFSVSSNRLSIQIVKKGKKPARKQLPDVVTPAPVQGKNNKLKSMKTTALEMTPDFSRDTLEYQAVVDCHTDILYTSIVTEDKKAKYFVYGNESLKTGKNQVTVQVTAENGEVRKYRIDVRRETEKETAERTGEGKQKEEKEEQDVMFSLQQRGDTIWIQTSSEFEVLDTDGMKEVPEGYIQTRLVLDGVSVPVFTTEEELDSTYLLLYLRGPSGERGLYQFDRDEKTLQRYTGSMVERINQGRALEHGSFFGGNTSNYIMLIIIVFLVIVVLCLLIAMLKMAIRRKEGSV